MPSWLVLDIGNTHTVAGAYNSNSEKLEASVRFRTDAMATSDEYRMELDQLFAQVLKGDLWSSLSRVIVSNVVPSLESVITEACRKTPCHFVRASSRREFELDLPFPDQLGADRLANVAGALTLVKGPFLIVDAGTATTFCLVDSRPAYVGGAITPGLEISFKALASRAAKLFSVDLKHPENSVGRTTESQLQSGVLFGYEALIEGMADRLLADAGPSFKNATLLATGGCVNMLKLSPRFRVEPDLTLKGLLQYGRLSN